MDKDSIFFRQAALMLRVLPIVNRETCFALKGGTAINFFVRDMRGLFFVTLGGKYEWGG